MGLNAMREHFDRFIRPEMVSFTLNTTAAYRFVILDENVAVNLGGQIRSSSDNIPAGFDRYDQTLRVNTMIGS